MKGLWVHNLLTPFTDITWRREDIILLKWGFGFSKVKGKGTLLVSHSIGK
jgi:hypothetical protein